MIVNNLSADLSDLGRFEEALEAVDEAVGLYRELAETRAGSFPADVAMGLTNRSEFLIALGRHEEAFDAAEEALHLLLPFWERNPGAYDFLMASLRQDYEAAAQGSGRKMKRRLWNASRAEV